MIRSISPVRKADEYGSGLFGASRGKRTHSGIDYAMYPGSQVLSPVTGRVTKLGYTYSDDLRYRYVQITDEHQYQHRFFYVEPRVLPNSAVLKGEVIGISQKLGSRYPRITEHVHYEIKKNGEFIDPDLYHEEEE
jgi:murein DD-endopeptidase MepM/ murein hydrolase activator NlpD